MDKKDFKPENTLTFGISQGRLTKSSELQRFPQESWQEEFKSASELGIECIEFLVERERNEDNPIWSELGRAEIIKLTKKYSVKLETICFDYIINHSLLSMDAKKSDAVFNELFKVAKDIGCKSIVLPLLEKSELNLHTQRMLGEIVNTISSEAKRFGLNILLETTASAKVLLGIFNFVREKNVNVVFDTGNRAHMVSDLYSEIILLADRIKHVHIKDKNHKGENVILGRGLVDFYSIFEALRDINYKGFFVFETTRGKNPLATAKYHVSFCNYFSKEAGYR